jgi:hypothetical protein
MLSMPTLLIWHLFQHRESWLSFYHRALNQNQDPGQLEPRVSSQNVEASHSHTSLRKMVQISDLIRFITEYV